MDIFTKYTAWLSGANTQALKICSEKTVLKFSIIGTIIFVNSTISGFAIGQAVYYIPTSKIISIIFGLIFTFSIFSIDRFISISFLYRRKYLDVNTDNLNKLIIITPLIFMSILIAFTTALPLQLKIMEIEIENHLTKKDQNKKNINKHNNKFSGTEEFKYSEKKFSIVERIEALKEISEQNKLVAQLNNALFILLFIINSLLFLLIAFSSPDDYCTTMDNLNRLKQSQAKSNEDIINYY